MKVALVHDWLTGMRGGEKCLEAACRRWPEATLHTLLHRRGSVSESIERMKPQTSWLGKLPGVHRYYRGLLPLMPFASWNIPPCDLVLSFSHCVAKSARVPGVPHVSYCFSPMRYAWQMRGSYGWKAKLASPLLDRLRDWDRRTSDRVTHFVAISRTIQQRIRECYQRDSVVIYPPVDVEYYTPTYQPREDFYLVVSALVPYKRFDLAVASCTKLGRSLVVIGRGPEMAALKALAGPTVTFLGYQPDDVIRDHYRRAKGLIFPAEEDFGIVPVEAQACGCPVIAYEAGGNTETVRCGVFFRDQTSPSLIDAIEDYEHRSFDPRDAVAWAQPFSNARYESELFGYVESVVRPESRRVAA